MPRSRLVDRLVEERLIAEVAKAPSLRAILTTTGSLKKVATGHAVEVHYMFGGAGRLSSIEQSYIGIYYDLGHFQPHRLPETIQPVHEQPQANKNASTGPRLNRTMASGPPPRVVMAMKPSVKHVRRVPLAVTAVGARHVATPGCSRASPPTSSCRGSTRGGIHRGAACLGPVVAPGSYSLGNGAEGATNGWA